MNTGIQDAQPADPLPPSRAVTANAIATSWMGVGYLALGSYVIYVGVGLLLTASRAAPPESDRYYGIPMCCCLDVLGPLIKVMGVVFGTLLTLAGALIALLCVPFLVGGAALRQRRRWARYFTIGLGALTGVVALIALLSLVQTVRNPQGTMPRAEVKNPFGDGKSISTSQSPPSADWPVPLVFFCDTQRLHGSNHWGAAATGACGGVSLRH